MSSVITRQPDADAFQHLQHAGMHPLFARIYAARGVAHADELQYALSDLLAPTQLLGIDAAASMLADAIEAQASCIIIADYDCDGATACAVGMRALQAMGAQVSYLVPDRFTLGYGLTPAIVELAAQKSPDVLITVDNGIASIDGVLAAQAHGMATIITDHHLPGEQLPPADVIVNPNQPDCRFPSKALAGVGVMFYTMLALRAELRARGAFTTQPEPNLAALLDLVALGTVADVVSLDRNNRILVAQGLARIRAGKMQPGLQALLTSAGRDYRHASTFDLGFAVGPRLNAAGRIADMQLGIECLLSNDSAQAMTLAQQLDSLNQQRRSIEQDMQQSALTNLETFDPGQSSTISIFQEDWHQGVIGIVASRLRDRFHRPALVFARGDNGELKGSGRSISGLHLRDALDLLTKIQPGLILRFGGHAMAAGLSIRETDFERFQEGFEQVVCEQVSEDMLTRQIVTDGSLAPAWMSLAMAKEIDATIWGKDFPAPLFADVFCVDQQRLLKEKHLKLRLSRHGSSYDAIYFNYANTAPRYVYIAYRLAVNEFNAAQKLQLMVEHLEAADETRYNVGLNPHDAA